MERIIKKRSRRPGGSILNVREIIDMIEDDEWYPVASKRSHRQYKNSEKPGRITIAGHPADDLAPGAIFECTGF